MIVIGEKINATRKAIGAAIEARDAETIARTAREQAACGATYLDVNGGDPWAQREQENMAWLMDIVQEATDLPICIDSAHAEVAAEGLRRARKRPIVNSITLEEARLKPMLKLLESQDCMVIALLMSDEGTPCGVEDRVRIAEALLGRIRLTGRSLSDIIIDPCFLPISTDPAHGRAVMDGIAAIRARGPEVHIGGGVSNLSFGLPKRRLVNVAAVVQGIYCGMDAAIVDPCTPGMMPAVFAAEAVAGRDDFCMNYVMAEREGKLV